MNNNNALEDEELVLLSQKGDDNSANIIMARYKPLVLHISKAYYISGAEQSDLIQEGMIGLFKAIRDYSMGKNAKFKTFATLCIKRNIMDAIKSANRDKHMPLNTSLSIDLPEMAQMLSDSYNNPEEAYLESEDHRELRANINRELSRYEIDILNLYLNNQSYQEIAEKLGKDAKSVDNAIQRIRKKIKKIMP